MSYQGQITKLVANASGSITCTVDNPTGPVCTLNFGASGSGVLTVNSLSGALSLVGGTGISVTRVNSLTGGITNSGTISAGAIGISVTKVGSFAGAINNTSSGTITANTGIKIGTVSDMTLDPKTYLVTLHLNIRDDIKIPVDSSLLVTSTR